MFWLALIVLSLSLATAVSQDIESSDVRRSSSIVDDGIHVWLDDASTTALDDGNHQHHRFDITTMKRRRTTTRSLQQTTTTCNTILATWTPEEVSTYFFNSLGNSSIAPLLELTLQGQFRYGVQIRIVCASCQEIMSTLDSTTSTSLQDICGSNVYGANANMSGLVMVPLTADASNLAPGTMKGVVYCHGTDTNSWPSIYYQGPTNTSVETLQFAAVVSLGGSVAILPDYMGFGASQGTVYKGYTVLKSYQTSFIPLWYQTQSLVAQESNCSTILSNEAAVVGYSEGGYASVAVAQSMVQAGIQVLHVDSGGAPFKVTLSILSIIQGVDDGAFDLTERYVFALIGSAYSGTYPLPNSNVTSQYLLASTDRELFVALVSNSSSSKIINAEIPTSNSFPIFNQQFVTLAKDAIAAGDFNPCTNNNSTQFQSTVGDLCAALELDDLTNYLETQVNYTVRLCHSSQDNLVSYNNLPNISSNSQYLSLIPGVTGTHQEASVYCVAQAFLYLIADFQNIVVPSEVQANGCSATTPAPSAAPVISVAPAPSGTSPSMPHNPTPTNRPSKTTPTTSSSAGERVKLAMMTMGAVLFLTGLVIC
jgi:hypothetical protein